MLPQFVVFAPAWCPLGTCGGITGQQQWGGWWWGRGFDTYCATKGKFFKYYHDHNLSCQNSTQTNIQDSLGILYICALNYVMPIKKGHMGTTSAYNGDKHKHRGPLFHTSITHHSLIWYCSNKNILWNFGGMNYPKLYFSFLFPSSFVFTAIWNIFLIDFTYKTILKVMIIICELIKTSWHEALPLTSGLGSFCLFGSKS